MNCEKCSGAIHEVDMYAVCEGKCGKRFHTSCVGMDKDQWNALFNNVIWLCEFCMTDFCKYRDRQQSVNVPNATRSVDEEIMDLKVKVATICETLATITAPKQPSSDGNTQRHSTPVSSPGFRGETSSSCVYFHADGCRADEQHPQTDNNTFELFLTNINPNVTEHEISLMVSRCLGTNSNDNLDVNKLVSKQIDSSKLDYVSFKVVLNENYRIQAMSGTTWPKRVKFREFVNRYNDTWRP